MQATLTHSIPGNYWQWRGHSIYYVQSGQNEGQKPPMLLVHGFGASTDHWRKNIKQLQEKFQVWAIDLLGFGLLHTDKHNHQGNYQLGLLADQ